MVFLDIRGRAQSGRSYMAEVRHQVNGSALGPDNQLNRSDTLLLLA
jgi:hypothetical protein